MSLKKIFIGAATYLLLAGVSAQAQQISVVSPGGTTSIYTDINLAIAGAEAGSTIYLPGGNFQANDATKITKKLTIIGIGHKAHNDNVDVNTYISGNLFFEGGSDNSILMAVYLSGSVVIATSATAVNNFLLKYCNVNSVQIRHANCQNILINQNYIRDVSFNGDAAVSYTNNILHSLTNLHSAIIDHNIFRYYSGNSVHVLTRVNHSKITNNILISLYAPSYVLSGSDCQISNNALPTTWGENSLKITTWSEVFEDAGTAYAISPNTNFHIKAGHAALTAGTDGGEVGIYGGGGFNDKALPPGPRIISKKIAEQTDESGNLHVEIQVSAD